MIESTQIQIGKLNTTVVKHSDQEPAAIVILCHGYGASGSDLVSIGSEVLRAKPELKNVAFIFPEAPLEIDPAFDGRAWWPLDMEKIQRLQMLGEYRELLDESPDELPDCRGMINEVIDFAMKSHDLPASKIFVGGFSQGAMLTTDVALHHTESLGGLIVWSGTLINHDVWREKAAREPMKVYASHGLHDPILPFSGAELLRDMLKDCGHDVTFIEFQGQHEIPGPAVLGALQLVEISLADQ